MIELSDRLTKLLYLGIACAIGLLQLGCEENVTAVTGTDRAFSFYGVLQPKADTQFISVYPITGRLAPTQPGPLDAEVTLTDQTTGDTYQLRDSVVLQDDGDYAHFFWTPIRAQYDHTYQIQARNSEDRTSSVEITVPPAGSLDVREPREQLSSGIVNPVYLTSDAPRLNHVEVEYFIKFDAGPAESTQGRVTMPYGDNTRKVEGGWMIDVNLSRDFETLRERLRAQGLWSYEYGITLLGVTLSLAVVNDEWNPPGGSFDSEVLVQPGTMSNVNNGFGFVGAGFRLQKTWLPDSMHRDEAGWSSP